MAQNIGHGMLEYSEHLEKVHSFPVVIVESGEKIE